MKFLQKLILFLNLIFSISLALAYASAYVNPSQFWFIAFFGLALPYLLIINLFFVVFWALNGNNKLFLSIIVIALGYKSIPTIVQFNLGKSDSEESPIKVMSFNVRVFDLYMWSAEKTTRNKIFDFLKKEDPDILCLQEFYNADKQDSIYEFKTLDTLKQFLSANNYHAHYTTTKENNNHFGIITFSKYPIINKGFVDFGMQSDNVCIYTDINYQDTNLRIFNSHLASIKLDKHDYKAVQGLRKNEYLNSVDKSLLLVEKLKNGFMKRSVQADSIKKSIELSPYPIILCGDFNDSPTSYAYQTIKGELKDAFMESGNGFGQTYIGDFPSFRIDFILHSKDFSSNNYQTHDVILSDHHPISSNLSL